MKKALLKDLDGSLLGQWGAVVPESEWEWNGDPRRGLGDYRIPKVMLTDLNGDKLAVESFAPNKGIVIFFLFECHANFGYCHFSWYICQKFSIRMIQYVCFYKSYVFSND